MQTYKIVKTKNKKTGIKKFLVIHCRGIYTPHRILSSHFDPHNNRRISASDYTWKFDTREEAEIMVSLALLKGLC